MQTKALAGGLLAVIAGGAAFFLWPSEASRVRTRVIAAADALSARPGEGDFDRLARLTGLAKALSPDVVVEAEPGGPAIRGREAVAALATRLSTAGGPQRVELSDVEVTLDDGSLHAVVTAIAHVTSAAADGGQAGRVATGFDGDVIRVELARTDDGWLITRASPAPTLAR
jgi:hypothetical protein